MYIYCIYWLLSNRTKVSRRTLKCLAMMPFSLRGPQTLDIFSIWRGRGHLKSLPKTWIFMQKSNERLRRLSLPISMGLIVNSQSGTTRTKRIHSANTANPAEQSTTTTATKATVRAAISTVESKETRLMSPTWILWKWLFGLPPLHQLIALGTSLSLSLSFHHSLFVSLSSF